MRDFFRCSDGYSSRSKLHVLNEQSNDKTLSIRASTGLFGSSIVQMYFLKRNHVAPNDTSSAHALPMSSLRRIETGNLLLFLARTLCTSSIPQKIKVQSLSVYYIHIPTHRSADASSFRSSELPLFFLRGKEMEIFVSL